MFKTLSGRFLLLTILFIMLAEILVFVPSVARFRHDYLENRLERAQIASLAMAGRDRLNPTLEQELLQNAEVFNIVLQRNQIRQLALSSPLPMPFKESYDLRDANAFDLIMDAFKALITTENHIIRVIDTPVLDGGELIEITMWHAPLRSAMLTYSRTIFLLSLTISIITASLLFLAVRHLMVRPIQSVSHAMHQYAKAPQDVRTKITPSSKATEIREAEDALHTLQEQLTAALTQQKHLAQLGGAVAKISHDLRNILTSVQLFSDRIEMTQDPLVQRILPKLVGAVTRAVNLCETTLAFGKAEEPLPQLSRLSLAPLIDDIFESEKLTVPDQNIDFQMDIPPRMVVRADKEQLFRALFNLTRNARQAIINTSKPGTIKISAHETDDEWCIHVGDTGPGLPSKAKQHLFEPFKTSTTKGGSGLGLVIASDLIQGHGGTIKLQNTGQNGTCFTINLPKGDLY